MRFLTADELFHAKIANEKSIRDRWNEIVLFQIGRKTLTGGKRCPGSKVTVFAKCVSDFSGTALTYIRFCDNSVNRSISCTVVRINRKGDRHESMPQM